MRSRPYVLLSILTGLAVASPAPARAIDRPQPAQMDGDVAGTVRFDLYQGHFIVAHGSAGPLKNLNFFLDTGTTLAVLDSRIAKKLNLQSEGPAGIVIVGGQAPGEEATLPSLEMGPVRRSNLQVVTTDLSFFQRTLPVRIDAIVGLDVLGQTPFVIDYTARVIRFGPSPVLAASVPLHLDRGLAVFDAEIDHTPVHLLFDTGAASVILFARGTQQAPGGDAALGSEEIGNFDSKQVRLHTLRLGPREFRQEPALVTRNPKPSQFDFDGLMSPISLGISRISFDLQRGVLAFSR